MPRTWGVSSSSTVWCMRFRPRPRTVAWWPFLRLIGLLTSVTRIIFLSAMSVLGSSISAGDLFDRLAALGRDLRRRVHPLQAVERRANDVVRVGRADAFREHVRHAHHFEYRPHRTAGDDSGSLRGGLHDHLGRSVPADDGVLERAVLEGHAEHLAARLFERLLNGDRHLARLALAHADSAVAVADHGERREAENPTSLDDLGDAVHGDHLLLQAVHALLATLHSRLHSRHTVFLRTLGRLRGPRPRAPLRARDTCIRNGRKRPSERPGPSPSRRSACRSPRPRPCCCPSRPWRELPSPGWKPTRAPCRPPRTTGRRCGRWCDAPPASPRPADGSCGASGTHASASMLSCRSWFALLLLRFLEDDLLVRVAHALALVGLGRAIGAHFGGHLPDELLVQPLDDDLGLRRRLDLHALGHGVHHRVRKAEREVELVSLGLGAVADP